MAIFNSYVSLPEGNSSWKRFQMASCTVYATTARFEYLVERRTAINRAGVNRTVFSTLKVAILCACQRKLCFLGPKKKQNQDVFWKHMRFTTVLEPFVGQLHFLPLHLRLLYQSLGSHSQDAVSAVLCWSLLILPFFLVWMPGGSLSLIFFHLRSIPPVCTLKPGFGPRRFKRTNSQAAWFTTSCFNRYVFEQEVGYAFAPSVTK